MTEKLISSDVNKHVWSESNTDLLQERKRKSTRVKR